MKHFSRYPLFTAALLGGTLAALAAPVSAQANEPDPNFALAVSLLGKIMSTAQQAPAQPPTVQQPAAPVAPQVAQPNEIEQASWATTAQAHSGEVGARFPYHCPAHGMAYTIYGTGIYTDASAVCTAAVHAGLINFSTGGTVTIEMRPGQNDYTSSRHHGVSSQHWGSWSSSFVFVNPA